MYLEIVGLKISMVLILQFFKKKICLKIFVVKLVISPDHSDEELEEVTGKTAKKGKGKKNRKKKKKVKKDESEEDEQVVCMKRVGHMIHIGLHLHRIRNFFAKIGKNGLKH